MNAHLDTAPEVAEALDSGKPVVALESTLISHGMPWPENAQTAHRIEAAVREESAVPATIALIDGRIKVGLRSEEIDLLAEAGTNVAKCSRRDLPIIVAAKAQGATTVAATMIVADMAGIRILATGGIGGVHRGAHETFDVSADLQELARTSVAVVCAGAKSILDLGLTLEYLETLGVPVIGYGTDELPAFYTRQSGLHLETRLDTPSEVATALHAKWAMNLAGGVVVANPISEKHAMVGNEIAAVIERAIDEAAEQGVHGKETTPFLLQRVAELTEGRSLASNIELVIANARLGARIAGELAQLQTREP